MGFYLLSTILLFWRPLPPTNAFPPRPSNHGPPTSFERRWVCIERKWIIAVVKPSKFWAIKVAICSRRGLQVNLYLPPLPFRGRQTAFWGFFFGARGLPWIYIYTRCFPVGCLVVGCCCSFFFANVLVRSKVYGLPFLLGVGEKVGREQRRTFIFFPFEKENSS